MPTRQDVAILYQTRQPLEPGYVRQGDIYNLPVAILYSARQPLELYSKISDYFVSIVAILYSARQPLELKRLAMEEAGMVGSQSSIKRGNHWNVINLLYRVHLAAGRNPLFSEATTGTALDEKSKPIESGSQSSIQRGNHWNPVRIPG